MLVSYELNDASHHSPIAGFSLAALMVIFMRGLYSLLITTGMAGKIFFIQIDHVENILMSAGIGLLMKLVWLSIGTLLRNFMIMMFGIGTYC